MRRCRCKIIAPWRLGSSAFCWKYLPTDRNFARNTQHSYRDALRLFVIFAGTTLHRKPDELLVEDLGADLVRRFMCHIEEECKCSVATRNQRLAALRTAKALGMCETKLRQPRKRWRDNPDLLKFPLRRESAPVHLILRLNILGALGHEPQIDPWLTPYNRTA